FHIHTRGNGPEVSGQHLIQSPAMDGDPNKSGPQVESVESTGITIRLDGFEGPLDLLLYLIKREEVDIWNIPIARITEQYLEYLERMKDRNINVTNDTLEKASTRH